MQWVDVRSSTEFAAGHLPGAVNIPLDELDSRLGDFALDLPVVLICKSGMRAGLAHSILRQCRQNASVLEGGTDAWVRAGQPLVISTRTRWSLERQVRLIAGSLVLLGAVLSLTFEPRWVLLSGFVGLGLTFAGFTDICPMGLLLGKMPWNGAKQSASLAPPDNPAHRQLTDRKAHSS
jgi:rhodanese-related sulfurtransferase